MKRISIVVPCFNEEAVLPALFAGLEGLARDMPGFAWEFVCVNDGSRDGTLAHLLAQQSRSAPADVVVVDLSRNFGKEAALSAGLATASGDAVIPFDADLQDPPEVIQDLLALWEKGNDVVVARRSDRDSDHWLKRVSARLFYRLHNAVSDVTIPPDVGDFRLMDRAVVDVVNALPENRRFMKGLFAWAGFRTAAVDYSRAPRSGGRSTLGGRALWHLAVEGITSFSLTPLRIASVIGLGVATVSLAYGAWIVVRTFIFGIDVPGYASIFTAVLFLGGLQLVCLGILGEYLGRAYIEAKRRPPYVIRSVHRGKRG
jgi:glycosyltransferase involved in cell wall biosynthesis